MNLYTKQEQIQTHKKKNFGYQKEEGRDKLGVWD